jgi:hypothetical protein
MAENAIILINDSHLFDASSAALWCHHIFFEQDLIFFDFLIENFLKKF